MCATDTKQKIGHIDNINHLDPGYGLADFLDRKL